MHAKAVANSFAWLGDAAATLTTASFVPQAWLTFRTGDESGIALRCQPLVENATIAARRLALPR